jgi:hypothetical protein
METKFENYEFDLTEEMIEVCDSWLKWKGYECIEQWAEKVVVPDEDDKFQLDYLKGDIGYESYYLYEKLSYKYLRSFTMTKESFLDFYFNTGDDQSMKEMRVDIGYNVVDAMLEGKEFKMPTAESLFDNCGYMRLSYCEGIVQGHPLEDYEDIDLDWDIEIKLVV